MAQKYTNSGLVVYTKLSPNYGSRVRSCNPEGKISKITIHHMAGNCTIEVCGNLFASASRQASSNYGVGTDGRIGLYVEEKNRPWTSSNGNNDSMAVTMEVANDGGASTNWHVSDKALQSTIDLCVDICRRNDIEELVYVVKNSELSNLTRHDWFAATTCPGPYLGGKFPYIVEEVNKRLGAEGKEPVTGGVEIEVDEPYWYRVRKSWKDAKSQIGAYTVLANAQKKADENEGYFVFDMDGKAIYPVDVEDAEELPTLPVTEEIDKMLWDMLDELNFTPAGKAGMIGNIDAESGLKPNNLQQTFEGRFGLTDESYTRKVDDGTYTDFVNDKAGYGLAQWTFWSRKQNLLNFCKEMKTSIGDATMQGKFLIKELKGYKHVLEVCQTTTDVREASTVILKEFEAPADQGQKQQDRRYEMSMIYYNKFVGKAEEPKVETPVESTTEPVAFESYMVKVSVDDLNIRKGPGTNYAKNGVTGKGSFTIVAESDGQGATKWGKLKSGAGWISLDYAKKVEAAKAEEPKVEKKEPTQAELEAVAKDVINGKYGNGTTRKNKLAEAGWDYGTVQTIVDQMMSGTYGKTTTAPAKKSNEEIAREVIRGIWSNGQERVNRLTAAGYDPKVIQSIVNSFYK